MSVASEEIEFKLYGKKFFLNDVRRLERQEYVARRNPALQYRHDFMNHVDEDLKGIKETYQSMREVEL